MEFQEKKHFLKNFDNFLSCKNSLSVIFGFHIPKLIKVPIFMKIQSTKLEIWTKMYYLKFPRWPPRGQKRGTVVQSFDHNISEIIWDRCLKFGTFTYTHSMYLCSKFHWNLKRWEPIDDIIIRNSPLQMFTKPFATFTKKHLC